jgi:hypothetical protein
MLGGHLDGFVEAGALDEVDPEAGADYSTRGPLST